MAKLSSKTLFVRDPMSNGSTRDAIVDKVAVA
jgi:hypothetical protein